MIIIIFLILFYGYHVSEVTSLCDEFHGRLENSLGRVESQRNRRSGRIGDSLAPLMNVCHSIKLAFCFVYEIHMHLNVH